MDICRTGSHSKPITQRKIMSRKYFGSIECQAKPNQPTKKKAGKNQLIRE